MTVGELRDAIEHVSDDTPIVIWDKKAGEPTEDVEVSIGSVVFKNGVRSDEALKIESP